MQQSKYGFSRCLLSALIILIVAFANGSLQAQSTTATILGTVTDPSGAAIPDAMIVATNTGTNVARNTVSDSQGRFRIPELGLGTYDIRASKVGFSAVVRQGITLTLGSEVVVPFSMQVGEQQQTITVQAEVSQVETQSTAVGTLVEPTQMRELPLNGRNFGQLILLAPGVQAVTASTQAFYGKGDNYSVAGSRPEGTAFLLDNTDISDFWNHGTGAGALGTQLGLDAIAEFQTLVNTYGAQFGGNGAVVSAVTRSGTNAFHGSAYEFLRNSALDARNFFDPATIAPFRRNQFGGTLGGPVKKDKAFFFVNYEGIRQLLGVTRVANVPDANAHNGYLPNGSGGLQFVGVNPSVASTLALYPLPTAEIFNKQGLPTGVGTVSEVANQPAHENYFIGRFDYTLSNKDSLFARYVRDTADLVDPFGSSSSPLPYWPEAAISANHYATIEERHIISPTLINLARVSFTRPADFTSIVGGTAPLQYFPGRINGQVVVSGLSTIGANNNDPIGLPENKYFVADDILWTHGAHSIKAGFEVERVQDNSYAPTSWGGTWTFTSLQSFLQGNASQLQAALPGASADFYKDFRLLFLTPYFQDDWKLSPRLTVNLGIRYEYQANPLEVRHQMEAFVNPPFGGFQTVTHAFANNPNTKNFNPRVGVAWDPFSDHKTSVRAGFGIFHDAILPKSYSPTYWLGPPFTIGIQQFPTYPIPFAGNFSANPTLFVGTAYSFNTAPYMIQYNFNIQHEFGRGNVLTVGYVGSQGVHLIEAVDLNPPKLIGGTIQNPVFGATVNPASGAVSIPVSQRLNPAFSSLNQWIPGGHSHYNSLQTSFNRRFSQGLQLQASYTFSKSIDNGSQTTGFDTGQGGAANPYYFSYDVGRSNFDHTHSLRTSFVYAFPPRKNLLLDGWQVSGLFSAATGNPIGIVDGPSMSGIRGDKPNYISGCDVNQGQQVSHWSNPACFSLEGLGTMGNFGRNVAIGPGLWNMDTALMKNTKITKISESFAVQFRAEFFNVFNHTNFLPPSGANLNVFVLTPNGTSTPTVGINPSFTQLTQTN